PATGQAGESRAMLPALPRTAGTTGRPNERSRNFGMLGHGGFGAREVRRSRPVVSATAAALQNVEPGRQGGRSVGALGPRRDPTEAIERCGGVVSRKLALARAVER